MPTAQELNIGLATNHGKEILHAHTSKSTGAHQKAVAYFKALEGDDAAVGDAPPQPYRGKRLRQAIQPEEENQIFLAYQCLRSNLTSYDYGMIAKTVYALGGQISANYMSKRFYREVQDVASSLLFESLVASLKESPVFCLNCDEGQEGHFVIRIQYLDAGMKARNAFWELRILAQKKHDNLCNAILDSFCAPGRLSREEFGNK